MTSVVASSESGPSEPAPTTDGAERASGDRRTSQLTQRFGLSLAVVAGVGLLLRLGYVVHIAQDIILGGDPLNYESPVGWPARPSAWSPRPSLRSVPC
jgi:hypothetical protein